MVHHGDPNFDRGVHQFLDFSVSHRRDAHQPSYDRGDGQIGIWNFVGLHCFVFSVLCRSGRSGMSSPAPTTCARIYASGAIPELEVFEAGFIHYANYLIGKKVLKPPYYFNLILGSLGTAPLDLLGLGHMISMLPNGAAWSVGGLGQWQLAANTLAIASGGHVRLGLEDNIHYNKERTVLATNPQLVERIIRIAKELGREPASPLETRELLGLGL